MSGSGKQQTPFGVALFGLGRAGNIHFHNLKNSCRVHLMYIVDLNVDNAKSIIPQYNLKEAIALHPDEADQVYKNSSIDGVFVCAPTYAHEEIVMNALKNGKAVFCEKPIAENVERTKVCYDEAKARGLPLLCSFNRRFDPSVQGLRQKVLNGQVGEVHSIKTCSRDHPVPPISYLKTSGGIFHDCGVHDIDMVCWILGEYPSTVYTQAHVHNAAIKEIDDVDTVAIVMKFRSGILCVVEMSRNACYGYDQRLEVLGSEGMLVSENQRPVNVHSYAKNGMTVDPLKYSFPQRYSESYVGAMDHFFNVLEGKEPLDISCEDTINCSEIASACEESYKTGLPVQLNIAPKTVNVAPKKVYTNGINSELPVKVNGVS